jgi:hypothetical protein
MRWATELATDRRLHLAQGRKQSAVRYLLWAIAAVPRVGINFVEREQPDLVIVA